MGAPFRSELARSGSGQLPEQPLRRRPLTQEAISAAFRTEGVVPKDLPQLQMGWEERWVEERRAGDWGGRQTKAGPRAFRTSPSRVARPGVPSRI
jgi:hypothetical protein